MGFKYESGKRLTGHESAKCGVIIRTNGKIEFVSYNTTVVWAVPSFCRADYYTIGCTGTYSATTSRQIGWFLKEYFPSLTFKDMKNIANTGSTIEARRYK